MAKFMQILRPQQILHSPCDKRGGSAQGQNLQPTTQGPFSLPFSAAPGSAGIIQREWWQNLVPIGSAELNGAFRLGRQGCHYPSSRSCTRRSSGVQILTPCAPPARAEKCKNLGQELCSFLRGKKNRKTHKLQGSLGTLRLLAYQNKQCLLAFPRDHSMWLWWHSACPGMNFRTIKIIHRMSGVG